MSCSLLMETVFSVLWAIASQCLTLWSTCCEHFTACVWLLEPPPLIAGINQPRWTSKLDRTLQELQFHTTAGLLLLWMRVRVGKSLPRSWSDASLRIVWQMALRSWSTCNVVCSSIASTLRQKFGMFSSVLMTRSSLLHWVERCKCGGHPRCNERCYPSCCTARTLDILMM
jgi:hypothetical protein